MNENHLSSASTKIDIKYDWNLTIDFSKTENNFNKFISRLCEEYHRTFCVCQLNIQDDD